MNVTCQITIIICTYCRPQGLRRLLASLLPQLEQDPGHELIVVNDGSHDAAYEAVLAEAGGAIRYEALASNQGIAAARNRGVELASSPFVAFIDDDCAAPDFWLDWLTATLTEAPYIDILSGTTRPLWPKGRTIAARRDSHFNLIPYPHPADGYLLFVTANVAIRRELLRRAGGFGFPGFVGAGEDSELCARLVRSGAYLRTDFDWYVLHEVGSNLRRQIRRFGLYGYSNVKMSVLPHAPNAYVNLADARCSWLLPYAREEFHHAWVQSEGFSPWRLVRFYGAATTVIIKLAYLLGCIKAARDRRQTK